MAGRPIYHESVAKIEACGGEEYVLLAVMNGTSTSAIASVADVSRGMLYEWLHKDSERWERYQQAREVGAYALADEARDIADTATNDSIAVDRERMRVRQWLAERQNRKDFGKEAGVQVSLSISDLHLQAVRAAPEREEIEAVDAEVIGVLPASGELTLADVL